MLGSPSAAFKLQPDRLIEILPGLYNSIHSSSLKPEVVPAQAISLIMTDLAPDGVVVMVGVRVEVEVGVEVFVGVGVDVGALDSFGVPIIGSWL